MPTVYITNYNPDYDYSTADELGETVIMSRGFIPEYKLKSLENTFNAYAKESQPDDYLLLSGTNIVAALAAAVWMKAGKSIKFLQHGKTRSINGEPSTTYIEHYVEGTNGTTS